MKRVSLILLFIFLLSDIVFSEVVGSISINILNSPPITGLYGYTVQYCNTPTDCMGYTCFLDYDGVSFGSWKGWCNVSSMNCYHDGIVYLSGSTICDSPTSYRTCSNSVWSSTISCGANQTCSGGNCLTTTTTDGGGSSTSNDTITLVSSIRIISSIEDFEIIQNQSVIKSVTVKNDGNTTLYNITLSLSGIDSSWFRIIPTKYDYSTKNSINNFIINFSIPSNAEVRQYTVTIDVTTSNTSVKDSKTFIIKVIPSNVTVEIVLLPQYNEYLLVIAELENNITYLENIGINVADLKSLLNDIKNKFDQINQSMKNKDYYTAKLYLDDVKNMIDNLSAKISEASSEKKVEMDIFVIILIVIIIVIIIFLLYILWPTKDVNRFHRVKDFISEKKEVSIKNKISKLFKKKKKEGKFIYEFKE
ncbi:MAG: hypothetical protein QXD48_01395 [Candidatus Aenigmatarchaeota archaeon]